MAGNVKRVGPPKATDLKGNEFTWSVPLNQVPSKEWSRFFAEPKETTAMCHPKRLGMMQQALVFKCEEAHVPTWVQSIDKWIPEAKRSAVEEEEVEKHRTAEQQRAEEHKQRRNKD